MERAELERYAALDASGFLPGVGEEPVDFESRIAAIRAAHEEFGEELAEKGEVVVTNYYDFLTLEHLTPVWSVTENGRVVQSGTLAPLTTKPHASETVKIPFTLPAAPKPGAEYFLNLAGIVVHFCLKRCECVDTGSYDFPWYDSACNV